MSVTLSHTSALQVVRDLRVKGVDLRQGVDHTTVTHPSPWVGRRWSMREFNSEAWRWPKPQRDADLHVLIPVKLAMRMPHVCLHRCDSDLPARSILRLDEHASVVSPELLFVQMAERLSLPELVFLGYELCGTFTRSSVDPKNGPVVDHVAPATSVAEIEAFVSEVSRVRGLRKAREALAYVQDLAASVPEALLATIYGLPVREYGYGMGPLTLNRQVRVSKTQNPDEQRTRMPDIQFHFAPVGINYDGEKDHLDLAGLIAQARLSERAANEGEPSQEFELMGKQQSVRDKVVDDMRRNREFLAKGLVILPMTKEDLYGQGCLDNFTRQLLACAKVFFHVDVSRYEKSLNDSSLRAERYTLIRSL